MGLYVLLILLPVIFWICCLFSTSTASLFLTCMTIRLTSWLASLLQPRLPLTASRVCDRAKALTAPRCYRLKFVFVSWVFSAFPALDPASVSSSVSHSFPPPHLWGSRTRVPSPCHGPTPTFFPLSSWPIPFLSPDSADYPLHAHTPTSVFPPITRAVAMTCARLCGLSAPSLEWVPWDLSSLYDYAYQLCWYMVETQ